MPSSSSSRIAVIGAGPAGLMAAETLAAAGWGVDVYDAMPSVGRKFLLAGVGGMNITHSEASAEFLSRYREASPWVSEWLAELDATQLREWIHDLGIDTFIGSSGRVFPSDMKAAPLLRAWLRRLREQGVALHNRHRWTGWSVQHECVFATPQGQQIRAHRTVILALGGGSWARLGSDGAWVSLLQGQGIKVRDLLPANGGFTRQWSSHLSQRFAGQPLKQVIARLVLPDGSTEERRGECIVTHDGLEGSLIYALSAPLRDQLLFNGQARLTLDLAPDRSVEQLTQILRKPRGRQTLASVLRKRAGLDALKIALVHECLDKAVIADADRLAAGIKALPVELTGMRPLDEAISSAGGVVRDALDQNLMLKDLPGVFCAGEMLDWEAPTGGYLLTACFASGRRVGQGVINYLSTQSTSAG